MLFIFRFFPEPLYLATFVLLRFLIIFHRFEVAGIHPKRRPPGTITQVSYDKKSMLPLV